MDAISDPERRHRGRSKPKSMLAGVLDCGNCGAPAYRMHVERGLSGQVYRCFGQPSCGTVPLVKVEATVEYILVATLEDEEIYETRLVPGQNWDAAITDTKFELRHLDPDAEDYDERHAELRAVLADLKARPSVPDRWERVGTGVSLSMEFAEILPGDRAAWLKRRGLTVRLWKDRVRVERDGRELGTSPLLAGPAQIVDPLVP